MRNQAALEYLVIIGAVVLIAGIVAYVVAGSAGTSKSSVLYSSCRQAATQCGILKAADPNANCSSCYEQCINPTNNSELFAGAIDCCLQGNTTGIFEGSTGCTAGCVPTETTETTCDDGIDNDCDGLIDCADYNCAGDPICEGIPYANFTYSCNVTTGTCDFNASNSTDPDGNIVSYDWDFGDGTTGSGVTVSHTYFSKGYYLVNLTVTDNDGKTNSSTTTIFIPRRWHWFTIDNAGFQNAHASVGFGFGYIHVFYESNTSGSYFLRHAVINMENGQKVFLTNVVGDPSQKVVGEISTTMAPPFEISYYEGNGQDLRYARTWWTSSGWQSVNELVDDAGDVGRYSDIALDSSGFPCISYYDNTNGDLKYAYWDGSNWNSVTVDSSGDVGAYSSIAFDSNGGPQISYYDATNGDLKVARGADSSGSSWGISTFGTVANDGKWTSIAIDSNDVAHISYSDVDNDHLKYLRDDPGSATLVELIDNYVNGNWAWNSIAVDFNNYPHVAYVLRAPYYDLKYAYKDSNGWHFETLDGQQNDDVLAFPYIAYQGDIAIVYTDQNTNNIKLVAYF